MSAACSCNIFWAALIILSFSHALDSMISLSSFNSGQGGKFIHTSELSVSKGAGELVN